MIEEKITAEFFSRRFSGIQHTIWGRNDKKLEDDLFVDVDPINYEVCPGFYMFPRPTLIQPPSINKNLV